MHARGSIAVVGLVVAAGCSRAHAPSPSPSPTPPAPAVAEANDAGATLRLATAVEDTSDAGTVAPPSLTGKKVLQVGDSMVGGDWGLSAALKPKFVKEGATFIRDLKVSETIKSYDKSSRLTDLLAEHDPDIVIITLGTNDALLPNPSAMAPHVQSIAKKVGNRECWWMGPPLWKPDTGILKTIRDNSAPCHFYDASKLNVQRGDDGVHPTDRGAQTWANAFWRAFRAPRPAAGALDGGVNAR